MKIKISILGSGNVATHLAKKFYEEGIKIEEVFSYNLGNAKILAKKINAHYTNNIEKLKEADLYIISILDDKIAEVSKKIPYRNKLVIHTSGSVNLDVLNSKNRRGVFYLLQTFSKEKKVDFSKIPICIESENKEDKQVLKYLANKISEDIYNISSSQRKNLHISAVFVCNFVNYLYGIGENICKENNLPFEILKPLIAETSKKVIINSPKESQTGPAKRNDIEIIKEHLKNINNKQYKEIYNLITNSIIDENNNN